MPSMPLLIAATWRSVAHERAVLVGVGGGLRSYAIAGSDVIDGYGIGEMSTSGRGQVLIPWPNRLQAGSYEFGGRSHQLALDEPSAGLSPLAMEIVFDKLLEINELGVGIVMVEQNAKKGLEFSDIGYVLVSGKLALAGKASELLTDPDVGRLFLGG